MSEYQIVSRKFRPQKFADVVSQEAIVKTLKNAIRFQRLSQAYLFCGSRGTGKTTLARLLAKAINCQNLSDDCEPCNTCSSCREIAQGSSLDVLEIDGASNRGIEDIRQINENVGYAPSSGKYKIYLIDEVHMLTKDAFNALLKTLEEPPPTVKFFFATTEPHKIPATILSRCQRFNLERISTEKIASKLRFVADTLQRQIDDEALLLIAQRAEGGLRDAESLLDQIMAFQDGDISGHSVREILGLMPQETFFIMDKAGEEGDFGKAFELAHQIFSQGKNLTYFVEELTEHIRTLLLIKSGNADVRLANFSSDVRDLYLKSAPFYSQEQCIVLMEYLVEAQQNIRFAPSGRIALEVILLHVMRSHFRISVEMIVKRLNQLEKQLITRPSVPPLANPLPLNEDPTPTPADLGYKAKPKATPPDNQQTKSSVTPSKPVESPPKVLEKSTVSPPSPLPTENVTAPIPKDKHSRYETLVQFAAVEWEGRVYKK